MAVDTRNKRASVIGLALAFRLVLPNPAGTIAQADRQQVAWSYAGIAAGIPVEIAEDSEYLFGQSAADISTLSTDLHLRDDDTGATVSSFIDLAGSSISTLSTSLGA